MINPFKKRNNPDFVKILSADMRLLSKCLRVSSTTNPAHKEAVLKYLYLAEKASNTVANLKQINLLRSIFLTRLGNHQQFYGQSGSVLGMRLAVIQSHQPLALVRKDS